MTEPLFAGVDAPVYRHPQPWNMDLSPTTMIDIFDAAVAKGPQRPMIDFMGRRFTYAAVDRASRRITPALWGMGYSRGDRIGLFLPNVPHYVAAYLGALRFGATVVNFAPLYSADKIAHQTADSGTRLLFTISAKTLLPTRWQCSIARSLSGWLLVRLRAYCLPPSRSPTA